MDFSSLNRVTVGTFGERVVIKRPDLPDMEDRVVIGVFDSRHYVVEVGEFSGSDLMTTIALPTADAALVTRAAVLVIRETRYRTKDQRPDGQGLVVFDLERADA